MRIQERRLNSTSSNAARGVINCLNMHIQHRSRRRIIDNLPILHDPALTDFQNSPGSGQNHPRRYGFRPERFRQGVHDRPGQVLG